MIWRVVDSTFYKDFHLKCKLNNLVCKSVIQLLSSKRQLNSSGDFFSFFWSAWFLSLMNLWTPPWFEIPPLHLCKSRFQEAKEFKKSEAVPRAGVFWLRCSGYCCSFRRQSRWFRWSISWSHHKASPAPPWLHLHRLHSTTKWERQAQAHMHM